MTINDIITKTNKYAITDIYSQLSAEEFNTVVESIKNILGVLLTQDAYDALVEANTVKSDMYYYIVSNSSESEESGDEEDIDSGTKGSVSGSTLTLTNASVSGITLTITNATVSGSLLTIN